MVINKVLLNNLNLTSMVAIGVICVLAVNLVTEQIKMLNIPGIEFYISVLKCLFIILKMCKMWLTWVVVF